MDSVTRTVEAIARSLEIEVPGPMVTMTVSDGALLMAAAVCLGDLGRQEQEEEGRTLAELEELILHRNT